MKQHLRFATMGALVLSAATVLAQQGVQVTVDGNPVHFQGQGPMMKGDRVLVPLRGVLEQMGADVKWNPDTQTVSARSQGTNVRLRIGERTASVNGQPVTLDVPAQIVGGSTMVPLRFVGEALGNTVRWDAQAETVEIMTGGGGAYNFPQNQNQNQDQSQGANRAERFHDRGYTAPISLSAGTVIPVTLDQQLSSDSNSKGDRFTAAVSADTAGLPQGTKVEGFVAGVRPRRGDQPGMLELKFDRIDLPSGDTYPMHGSLIGLDDKSVTHRGGRLVARKADVNRAAFTGIGAGAGFIVGLMGHRPIEDTVLGALLGYGAGALQAQQGVHNVVLNPGTQFGVRLNSDLSIN